MFLDPPCRSTPSHYCSLLLLLLGATEEEEEASSSGRGRHGGSLQGLLERAPHREPENMPQGLNILATGACL